MEFDEAENVVTVDRAARSLSGRVRVAGQADRAFAGWFGLLAALRQTAAAIFEPEDRMNHRRMTILALAAAPPRRPVAAMAGFAPPSQAAARCPVHGGATVPLCLRGGHRRVDRTWPGLVPPTKGDGP